MIFKKDDIETVVRNELNSLRKDRDLLLEDLKDMYPSNKDLVFVTNTIATYNAIINELEHIIDKSNIARVSN